MLHLKGKYFQSYQSFTSWPELLNQIAFQTAEICLHLGEEIGGEKESNLGTRCNFGKKSIIILPVTKLTNIY